MTAAITDFNQFTGLRAAADRNDPAALREVATQFEALFLQSMLKSMRDASLGDPLFGDNNQHEMYQGMLDQQFALEMSSGKGIGLADMLIRQLGGDPAESLSRPDRPYPLSSIRRGGAVAATTAEPAWPDPKSFAHDIWPHAERAASKLNVPPEAIVAQAALETGWGAHVMPDRRGDSSLNLFGIKAGSSWSGDQVTRQTLEFEDGIPVPQKAQFRAYPDLAATFDDYTRLLTENPRYSGVQGHGRDGEGFANALQSSGYATDPLYADKITRILNSPTMQSVISELKNSSAQPIPTHLLVRAH